MTGTTTLAAPGTVVDYHGSKVHYHGRYVVIAADGGRYRIMDPDYTWCILKDVHPESVTVTGETIALCAECLHPADGVYGQTSMCFDCRDMCPHHGECVYPCEVHVHVRASCLDS